MGEIGRMTIYYILAVRTDFLDGSTYMSRKSLKHKSIIIPDISPRSATAWRALQSNTQTNINIINIDISYRRRSQTSR